MVENVEEKIPVMVRFRENRFEPVRFRWRERLHRIRAVTGRWSEHDGQYKVYHFAAVSESDDFYEISFRTRSMEWWLDRFMAGEPE